MAWRSSPKESGVTPLRYHAKGLGWVSPLFPFGKQSGRGAEPICICKAENVEMKGRGGITTGVLPPCGCPFPVLAWPKRGWCMWWECTAIRTHSWQSFYAFRLQHVCGVAKGESRMVQHPRLMLQGWGTTPMWMATHPINSHQTGALWPSLHCDKFCLPHFFCL